MNSFQKFALLLIALNLMGFIHANWLFWAVISCTIIIGTIRFIVDLRIFPRLTYLSQRIEENYYKEDNIDQIRNFLESLTMLFFTLKAIGFIDWNWIVVLLPFLIPLAIFNVLVIVYAGYFIYSLRKKRRAK